MSTDEHQRPIATEDDISERRRQMLRAAATAAPLVATLPSGAAWAHDSLFQCQQRAIDATDPNATGSPPNVDPSSGNWVTESATKLIGNRWSTDSVGNLTGSGTDVTLYQLGGTYYEYEGDDLGTDLDKDPASPIPAGSIVYSPDPGQGYAASSTVYLIAAGDSEPVQVLRFFEYNPSDPLSPARNCNGTPIVLTSDAPPQCLYPATTRTAASNLTALNNSCMTSIVLKTLG